MVVHQQRQYRDHDASDGHQSTTTTKVTEESKRSGLVSRRVEMFEASKSQDSHESHGRYGSRKGIDRRQSQSSYGGSDDDTVGSEYAGSAWIQTGVVYYEEGNFDSALKAFTTALKTQRVSVGDEDISIALTLGNLGSVYLQIGDLNMAESVLLESLLMKRRLKPKLIVADTLNNLGNCANLRGDLEKSLEYYREALVDLKRKKGRPEDLANSFFNIGRLEIQLKDWEAAMNMLTQAYQMTREIYGQTHAFVGQTLDLIGFVQLSTDDYDASMISFTKALGIFRRLHGPLHLDVANSLFNVGMVREAKGELVDAWESYSTTRDLYTRLGTDKNHPGFKTVRRSLAKVEKAIAKQNQNRLIEKHTEAKDGKTSSTASHASGSTMSTSSKSKSRSTRSKSKSRKDQRRKISV